MSTLHSLDQYSSHSSGFLYQAKAWNGAPQRRKDLNFNVYNFSQPLYGWRTLILILTHVHNQLPSKWAYTITIKKCTHSYRHLHNLKKKIRDHLKNGFVTFTGKNACQITWYMVTDYYYTKVMDIKLFKYVLDGGFFKDVSNCRAFYFKINLKIHILPWI